MSIFDTSWTPPSSIGYTPSIGTTTGSTGSGSGGFFKSDTGKNLISQGISSLFSFGISAFSSNQERQNLKGQANIVAQQGQSALAVEQERTKQAQLALEAAKAGGGAKSGSTALYIGLGVGAVVILGIVIFAVTRKKS
jgi:hypothetical protein